MGWSRTRSRRHQTAWCMEYFGRNLLPHNYATQGTLFRIWNFSWRSVESAAFQGKVRLQLPALTPLPFFGPIPISHVIILRHLQHVHIHDEVDSIVALLSREELIRKFPHFHSASVTGGKLPHLFGTPPHFPVPICVKKAPEDAVQFSHVYSTSTSTITVIIIYTNNKQIKHDRETPQI